MYDGLYEQKRILSSISPIDRLRWKHYPVEAGEAAAVGWHQAAVSVNVTSMKRCGGDGGPLASLGPTGSGHDANPQGDLAGQFGPLSIRA